MRIGIDFRMAGIKHGGIGRYVLELISHLLKIDRDNEFYIFYNDDSLPEGFNPEYLASHSTGSGQARIKMIKTNIRHYTLAEQIRFPLILNKYSLDLVHFPNFNVPIFYKKPFVATIHDLIHHRLGGVKKGNLLSFAAYKQVIKIAAQQARQITTVSKASKMDIVNEFKIPIEKVTVIYQGVAEKEPAAPKQIADFKAKFYINKPYFLFVGVMQKNKNLSGLAKGFDYFLQKYGLDFDLVIAGKKDPHYPEIKDQCLKIKYADNLVFTGPLDEEDLTAAYTGAYAFTSASVFEGFGLPGVEAMHFGLPLAVSNIPVFNEIYEDGAIYFDPQNPENIAQCLNLLAQDRLYYMQVKKKAVQRSKAFSWEKCARETLEVYNLAMSKNDKN